ncbi:MAG: ATP-binding cassette domain-containing protein [Candidatus Hodarchaeales archaeon]
MTEKTVNQSGSTSDGQPFLKCVDLFKAYSIPKTDIRVPALRGLNLTVNRGEFVAIIGPSGSGKSTLLRLLAGYDFPTTGDVIHEGRSLVKLSRRELRKYHHDIGFLYQLPEDNLLPHLDLMQNVLLPMLITSRFGGEREERAVSILTDLGLGERIDHDLGQLSGGEIQRAGLAVALAKEPVLLLADEPTGELDAASTVKLISLLKNINKETGLTVIVVTHDYRFAREVDIVYRLRDGKIVSYMDDPRVLADKADYNESVFIDPDGTLRLPDDIKAGLNLDDGDGIKFKQEDGKVIIEIDRRKKKTG